MNPNRGTKMWEWGDTVPIGQLPGTWEKSRGQIWQDKQNTSPRGEKIELVLTF